MKRIWRELCCLVGIHCDSLEKWFDCGDYGGYFYYRCSNCHRYLGKR